MLDTILQFAGLAIGLVYLYYEYHADAKVWIVGLIMPLISMWVYFRKGLYADFGMNIYYLAMAVYGYLAWTGLLSKGKKKDVPLQVRHTPWRVWLGTGAVTGLIWVAIAVFLLKATDSTVPWADAFTTAGSISATWMLARKYVGQWLIWLVVDAVCVVLYIYKGIYPYAALYTVYCIIAVLGFRKWSRMAVE